MNKIEVDTTHNWKPERQEGETMEQYKLRRKTRKIAEKIYFNGLNGVQDTPKVNVGTDGLLRD